MARMPRNESVDRCASFTLCSLPAGIGRTLIPRYFRSIFEGGVTDLRYELRHPKESFHNTSITMDCDQCTVVTLHGKPMFTKVYTEGRLIVEFTFDDMMRIRSWHFAVRNHRELIPRSLLAMQQEPAMIESLSKNVTRQGLTSTTLNYLRVSERNVISADRERDICGLRRGKINYRISLPLRSRRSSASSSASAFRRHLTPARAASDEYPALPRRREPFRAHLGATAFHLICFMTGEVATNHLNASLHLFVAVRHSGTDARVDVPAQSVRAQPARLPEDDALPEVAEDGGAAR